MISNPEAIAQPSAGSLKDNIIKFMHQAKPRCGPAEVAPI